MNGGKRRRTPATDQQHRPTPASGLPVGVTVFVVVMLTTLLAYNIIIVGPEGLPTSYVLGGLLGAYSGADQLLRRRDGTGGGGSTGGTNQDQGG